MSEHRHFVTPLHEATNRDCLSRMQDDKVFCMSVAKKYEEAYWDGDRRYGYGGYQYIPGRWTPVATAIIETYQLTEQSAVLDVGCGKGYLLYELKHLLPGITVVGCDISEHARRNAHPEIREYLVDGSAHDVYPYLDNSFDLVVSLGCLHNLKIFQLKTALNEIERVGKHAYIMVESYRNDQELFNLQCWALTAETFLEDVEWAWIFETFRYTGDYEFIFF